MKIFVDTGDIEEVKQAADFGILDGVTTNPSLIAKTGKGFKETVLAICKAVPGGEISAEVVATNFDDMLKEALEVSSWHPQILVKVPMIPPGVKLLKELSGRGIKTNCTLVFSVSQALLAAKAGATFISNFVGRVDDTSGNGMEAVRETVNMVENYGYDSQILVASVRHPLHVVEALGAGAHIATLPFKIFQELFKHPLTDIGLERFLDDWNKAGLSILEKKQPVGV